MKKPSPPKQSHIRLSVPDAGELYVGELAARAAYRKKWRQRHPDQVMKRWKRTDMTRCFEAIEKGLCSAPPGVRYVTKGDLDERLREVGGVRLTKAQLARWKQYGRKGVARVLADRRDLYAHLERLHGTSPQRVTQGQLVRFILHYEPTLSKSVAVKFAQLYLLLVDYAALAMPLALEGSFMRTVPFRRLKPYVTKLYQVTQELRRRLPKKCDRLLDELGYPPLPPLHK